MKKTYIQPQITASIRYSLEKPLCVSGDAANFGNLTDKHATSEYFNEGYRTSNPQMSDVIGIGKSNGDIDSQTKGRGGDWGSIW